MEKIHIIGRDDELAELNEICKQAKSGAGRVVFVAGEAGIGKTRLAEAFLQQSGVRYFVARTIEEATPPYGPFIGVLRAWLREMPEPCIDCGPFSNYLALLLPELGHPPENVNQEILTEALCSAFETMAGQEPTVIFFDDLQWADNTTMELLPALSVRFAEIPLLLMATYRSDEIPRGHRLRRLRNELRRARQLHEIQLGPFETSQCDEMLAQVLGAQPNPELSATICEQTQGVPLFIEELAQALVDGNLLQQGPQGLELGPGKDVPIPESIRDAVLLRLDNLSPQARNQIEVAAVAGLEFSFDLMVKLVGDESGVDELLDHNLIIETSPGQGSFRHALMREAVLGEIMWSRRRTLNRSLAQQMEATGGPPELIAEHWLAANELERAREALLQSAMRSCHIHAYRDAALAAHRALEIWPEGEHEDKRLDTLESLAHCAQISGQLSDAIKALREIVESLQSKNQPRRLAEAQRSLAIIYGLQGAWEQAIQCRHAAADAFELAANTGEAALEYLAAGGRLTGMQQFGSALENVAKAYSLAQKADRFDIVARAQALKGNILAMTGKVDEGRETVQAALSLALKHHETEAASEAYRRLASVLESASDYPAAREAYFTAYDYCRSHGEETYAQLCLGCMSGVLFQAGDWKKALEVSKEVLQNPSAAPGSRSVADVVTGMIRILRGETRNAKKHLKEALEVSRKQEVIAVELTALWGLALVAEQEDDREKAEANYRAALLRWQDTHDLHDAIPVLAWATTFFAQQGLEEEASQCADALASISSATGNIEAMAALALALGETAMLNNQLREAVTQFQQALDHLENLDLPLDYIRADYRAGVALARNRQKDKAVVHLRNAYRHARKLGMRPLAGVIAKELETLGETTEERRSETSGERASLAGLTGRQVEIARLMATGLTNKEIAGRLFLSPRTVDMHVSHILDRLDCRSRAEAVRRAAELGVLE